MATSADFEDFLSCAICYDSFDDRDPRALNCHHGFCLKCLKDIHRSDLRNLDKIVCPSCKQITHLANKSPDELKPYFQANQVREILERTQGRINSHYYMTCMLCRKDVAAACCLSCAKTLCGTCFEKHKKTKRYENHVSTSCLPEKLYIFACPTHAHSLVESFCIDCKIRICSMCIVDDHEGHRCSDFSLHKAQLKDAELKIARDVYQAKKNSNAMSTLEDAIRKQIQALDDMIQEHQSLLHKTIDDQVKGLRKKLQNMKIDALTWLDDITKNSADAEPILQNAQRTLATLKMPIPNQRKINIENIQIIVDELLIQLPRVQAGDIELGDLKFVSGLVGMSIGDLEGSLIQHSSCKAKQTSVVIPTVTDLDKSQCLSQEAKPKSVAKQIVGDENGSFIQDKSHKAEQKSALIPKMQKGGDKDSLIQHKAHQSEEKVVIPKIQKIKQRMPEPIVFKAPVIVVTPPTKTKPKLIWRVQLEGGVKSLQYLPKGNIIAVMGHQPHNLIKVYTAQGKVSTPVFNVSAVKNPWYVSVHNPSSTIAILDKENHFVRMFKKNGLKWQNEKFTVNAGSCCICVMPCGDIISDGTLWSNTAVIKYSENGNKLLEKHIPHDYNYSCAVDGNRIIVSDNGQLYVYSDELKLLSTISSGPGYVLKEPRGICVTTTKHILVADTAKKAVFLFSPDGDFIREVITLREETQYLHIALHQDRLLAIGSDQHKDICVYDISDYIN